MSLNEKMTGLMNAARNKFAVTDKLGIDDLKTYLEDKNIGEGFADFSMDAQSATRKTEIDGYQHFECVKTRPDNLFGCYQFNRMDHTAPYLVSVLVRGSSYLEMWGDEPNLTVTNAHVKLDQKQWKLLVFKVVPTRNILFYCKGNLGDFMDLKNMTISKLGGGAIKPVLSVIKRYLPSLIGGVAYVA